jgi:hypothetical protein
MGYAAVNLVDRSHRFGEICCLYLEDRKSVEDSGSAYQRAG